MNFLSRQAFTCLAVLVATGSIGYNVTQKQQIDQLTVVKELTYQKESILANGYTEQVLARLDDLKQNQIELARNQGRIEGIVSVVENFKQDENINSGVWHNGYYRGLSQVEDVGRVRYEEGYHKATADGACPAPAANVKAGGTAEKDNGS